MSALVMLLPMIIMFVFLIVILLLSNKLMKFGRKLLTPKRIGIVVIGYIAIGIVVMLVMIFTENEENKMLSKAELQSLIDEQNKIWNLIDEKRFDELNEDYITREWSYQLPTDELVIKDVQKNSTVNVVVKWRDAPHSNEIFGKTFKMPYVIKGIEITKKLPDIPIEFSNSELIIDDIKEKEIVYYKVEPKVEIIESFRGWDLANEIFYNRGTGYTILYLNVPKHINIIDERNQIYSSTY